MEGREKTYSSAERSVEVFSTKKINFICVNLSLGTNHFWTFDDERTVTIKKAEHNWIHSKFVKIFGSHMKQHPFVCRLD